MQIHTPCQVKKIQKSTFEISDLKDYQLKQKAMFSVPLQTFFITYLFTLYQSHDFAENSKKI
jgi:hypothetical protein